MSRPFCLRVLAQARHEGVCKKNTEHSKKRKKFDSSKQRLDHIPAEVKSKIAASPSTKQQHTVSNRKMISSSKKITCNSRSQTGRENMKILSTQSEQLEKSLA